MDEVARNTVTGNSATGRKMRTIPRWPRVTRPRTVYYRPCVDGKKHERQTCTQASAVDDRSSVPSMGLQDVNSPSRKDNLQFASEKQYDESPQSDAASSSSPTPADRNSPSLDLTLATNFGEPLVSLDPASFYKVIVNEAGESNYGIRVFKKGDLLLFGKSINLPTMKKSVIDENAGDNQMLSLSLGLESDQEQNVLSEDSSYIKGDGHLFSLYPSYNNVEKSPLFAPNHLQFHPGFPPLRPPYGMTGPHFPSTGPYPYYSMSNWGNNGMGVGFRPSGPGMQQISNSIHMNNTSGFHPLTSQASAVMSQQNSTVTTTVPAANNAPNPTPGCESNAVSQPPVKARKPRSDNFPTNVKTLLYTGVFQGVVVKYVSWARDKSLRGYINRTGYRCTCKKCEGKNEILNAFEFEKHAGCKSKHPNSHIYFSNGKSIYGVVQELQNTPFATLVEVMQNITGGSIHERNFAIWKEKFKAASLELQRIEGKGPNAM